MINNCENCYYHDKCSLRIRCEYYDPLLDPIEDESKENVLLGEYLNDLQDRESDYEDIVKDFD